MIRDLQIKFAESKTFASLLEETRNTARLNGSKRRRVSKDNVFKIGHGGTLDPLATGILIIGLGRGTKYLSEFLECKKTYETVVLFGKSTTTYDVAGKVVAEAPTSSVTRAAVEEQLVKFRGKSKQIPPIYSAIKIDGMKLYDYARTGKELPRELESRDIEVSDCTLLDFWEAGEHDFRYPAEQASDEEKTMTKKIMEGVTATKKSMAANQSEAKSDILASKAGENSLPPAQKAALHTHPLPTQEPEPAQAPAARIRLTVSSGFYVRSFCHDLGINCGSWGTMAALIRSQQSDFTTLDPAPEGFVTALTYEDLDAGEEVWGPKIRPVLQKWLDQHPPGSHPPAPAPAREAGGVDNQGRNNGSGFKRVKGIGGQKRSWNNKERDYSSQQTRRRNSSSPEA